MRFIEVICITIVDFFKLFLNWPGVFLLLMLLFRSEFSGLINRLKYIGVGDKRAIFDEQEQKAGVEELEKKAKELDKIKNVKDATEREKLKLTKELFFERTYTLILRSQIDILRYTIIIPLSAKRRMTDLSAFYLLGKRR